ncbi:Ty3/gypsy retrotransposon protein [Quillaja saponaria]|uniref:RNA-directed DNA polymerase n=1 Tax=Quillaja saponaria TaxID=32244 RepID=A0AAD7LAT4_QUISA|nr:Ty3/gypsy retrotransposon protein [Quillaja saponaria]
MEPMELRFTTINLSLSELKGNSDAKFQALMEAVIALHGNKAESNHQSPPMVPPIHPVQPPPAMEQIPPIVPPAGLGIVDTREYHLMKRAAQVEFPKFEGDNLRNWLFKCQEFFKVDQNPEEMKVRIAAMHFGAKLSEWYQGYLEEKGMMRPPWNELVQELQVRFQEKMEEEVAISVHVLTGLINNDYKVGKFQTMKVLGTIKKQKVNILIDSGSTHNFIDTQLAKRLGLRVQQISEKEVMVANGSNLMISTLCRQLPWSLSGAKFFADFLVMPLGSYGMVLGIQWLSTLGDIRWNFQKLTMNFTWQQQNIMLQGYFNSIVLMADGKRTAMNLASKDSCMLIQVMERTLGAPPEVLQILKDNTLFAKKTKCIFGSLQVEYLGHIISAVRVSADAKKIEAMTKWPVPKTVKELRGFLGLTGYYRRFIRDYGKISRSLTMLLKKNSFEWSKEAEKTFLCLKQSMTQAPILSLPDYKEVFTIETDASGGGTEVVLMQKGHPITFISKVLGPKHLALSTYEKELIAMVYAVRKWKQYLAGNHFIVKTDHQALKHLLEQKECNGVLQKWLSKLMGLDYEIQYKKGKDNTVADALSRVQHDKDSETVYLVLSVVTTDLVGRIVASYQLDDKILKLMEEVRNNSGNHKNYVVTEEGGHSGVHATLKRLGRNFYWKGMQKEVRNFIRCCEVCQRFKGENVASPGLLQPLSIPNRIWNSISMDFIEGLPKSEGKLHQVQLSHSTAYHPQSDGQTEAVNRSLEAYLRCFAGDSLKQWAKWLPLAQYWYNTSHQTAINITPYQALFGQEPPSHVVYNKEDSSNDTIDRSLTGREAMIQMLKYHLAKTQNRMKVQADKHKTDRVFQVGEWVYLRLKPYRQGSLHHTSFPKLAAKYYGPYLILARVRKWHMPWNCQLTPKSIMSFMCHF